MPRTTTNKTPVVGPYPVSVPADSLDINFQAADTSNLNQFAPGGDDLILAWNTHATNPYTFTVTSAPDGLNRTGDITTYSIGAGEIAQFRVKNLGWVQSDGKVYIQASNSAVKFGIIAL